MSPVVLQRLRHGAMVTIGQGVLASMDLTIGSELMGREGHALVAKLVASVLAQDLGTHTQVAVAELEWHMPATWFQHWKATTGMRWAVTRWWVRRHPPRMATVTQKVPTEVTWRERAGFPHSSIVADPRLGTHVLYVSPEGPPVVGHPSAPHYRTPAR